MENQIFEKRRRQAQKRKMFCVQIPKLIFNIKKQLSRNLKNTAEARILIQNSELEVYEIE